MCWSVCFCVLAYEWLLACAHAHHYTHINAPACMSAYKCRMSLRSLCVFVRVSACRGVCVCVSVSMCVCVCVCVHVWRVRPDNFPSVFVNVYKNPVLKRR